MAVTLYLTLCPFGATCPPFHRHEWDWLKLLWYVCTILDAPYVATGRDISVRFSLATFPWLFRRFYWRLQHRSLSLLILLQARWQSIPLGQ